MCVCMQVCICVPVWVGGRGDFYSREYRGIDRWIDRYKYMYTYSYVYTSMYPSSMYPSVYPSTFTMCFCLCAWGVGVGLVYIYMYIYIYIYICVHVCIFYLPARLYLYVCMCVCVCACLSVCMYMPQLLKPPWERVLWKKQPYEDNYVDRWYFFDIKNQKNTCVLSKEPHVWQFPLKMLHPHNPPNPDTQISRYKFKLDQDLSLDWYREIPRNLSL